MATHNPYVSFVEQIRRMDVATAGAVGSGRLRVL